MKNISVRNSGHPDHQTFLFLRVVHRLDQPRHFLEHRSNVVRHLNETYRHLPLLWIHAQSTDRIVSKFHPYRTSRRQSEYLATFAGYHHCSPIGTLAASFRLSSGSGRGLRCKLRSISRHGTLLKRTRLFLMDVALEGG